MFKIIANFKILDLGVADNGNLKGIIGPSVKQGASDPICGLTGLCVYLFYPNYFFLKSTSFLPSKKKQNVSLTMNWADVLFSDTSGINLS